MATLEEIDNILSQRGAPNAAPAPTPVANAPAALPNQNSVAAPAVPSVPAQTAKTPDHADLENRVNAEMARRNAHMLVNDASHGADMSTIAVASLAEDPNSRMAYYASKRFPNMPLDKAMQNYSVIDGQIAYRGNDGKYYAENPDEPGWFNMGDWGRYAASAVGPAFPVVGAIGGGIAGTAGAPGVGTVVGSGGGAALGESARQLLANQIMGQQFSPKNIAIEGAMGAFGELAGQLILKGVAKPIISKAAGIYRKALQSGAPEKDAVEMALRQVEQDTGHRIHLTIGEMTNNPTAKGMEKAAMTADKSAESMHNYMGNRAAQLNDVIDKNISKISNVDSPTKAGQMLQETASNVAKAAKQQRAAVADGLYKKAFDEAKPVNTQPVIDLIDSKMNMAGRTTRTALKRVKAELFDGTPANGAIKTNIEALHNGAKSELDNLIGAATRKGENGVASSLMEVKNQLLDQMDNASPVYKEARNAYATASGDVNAVKGSLLDSITGKQIKNAESINKTIFQQGPEEIARARRAATMVDGGKDAWNANVRAYLQNTLDGIKADNMDVPGQFAKKLFGNSRSQAQLKAALNNEQFKSIQSMMKVLDASTRVVDGKTEKAFVDAIANRTVGKSGSKFAKIAGGIVSPDIVTNASRGWNAWHNGNALQKLADIITNPNAMKYLRKAEEAGTGTKKGFIYGMAALGTTLSGPVEKAYDSVSGNNN